MTDTVPFPRSYWVEPGRLLAGAYPGDPEANKAQAKLRALHEVGIRHVISLMEPNETAFGVPFRPYASELAASGITSSRYPIPDVSVPSRAEMIAILDDIDAALIAGQPVFVHCWGGRGRTGTVIGCWLRRHKRADADSVLDMIASLRTASSDSRIPSPDTAEQRQFIRRWQEESTMEGGHDRSHGASIADRLAGAIWGHLVGDALGVPYEFKPPSAIGDPVWGHKGTHRQPPGTWSDDGGLMLALLDSMLSAGFNPEDQGARFLAWRDTSSYKPGNLFDIGSSTSAALDRPRSGTLAAEQAGGTTEGDNGNGSLMRILPVALVGRALPTSELVEWACRSSSITHGHARSQATCAVYCLVVRRLLTGEQPKRALSRAMIEAESCLTGRLAAELITLRQYSKRSGSGYVLDCFWSAWDAFDAGTSYEEVVVRAIKFGNDTDTTAAVAGGLAGASFGKQSIPSSWLGGLRGHDIVSPLVEKLLASAPA